MNHVLGLIYRWCVLSDIQKAKMDYLQYTENNYMDMESAKQEYLLSDEYVQKWLRNFTVN